QALTALLPLLGVERAYDAFAVQLHAGEDLSPEHETFDVAGHGRGNGPKAYAARGPQTTGQQGLAVGTERDQAHGGLEVARRADEFAGGSVPDAGGLVAATGGEEAIIGTKRDRLHTAG